jgi:hypothetical protein
MEQQVVPAVKVSALLPRLDESRVNSLDSKEQHVSQYTDDSTTLSAKILNKSTESS